MCSIIRELVALLVLSVWCRVTVIVLCRFLTVPWFGLQCVIVAFPGQTHLLYLVVHIYKPYHSMQKKKHIGNMGSVWHNGLSNFVAKALFNLVAYSIKLLIVSTTRSTR